MFKKQTWVVKSFHKISDLREKNVELSLKNGLWKVNSKKAHFLSDKQTTLFYKTDSWLWSLHIFLGVIEVILDPALLTLSDHLLNYQWSFYS